MIEFISIVVLTFAFALIVLGAITAWLERGRGRVQGFAMVLIGLLVAAAYAFLASRARNMFSRRQTMRRLNRAAGMVMITTGIIIATRS